MTNSKPVVAPKLKELAICDYCKRHPEEEDDTGTVCSLCNERLALAEKAFELGREPVGAPAPTQTTLDIDALERLVNMARAYKTANQMTILDAENAIQRLRVAGAPAVPQQNFNDDMIQRNDLPRDAFGLIHDLAYDHEGRERFQYRTRAQKILAAPAVGTDTQPDYDAATNWLEKQFPYPAGPRSMTWAEIIACLALYKSESVAAVGTDTQLCAAHAESWFCERNHLPAKPCVVCAFLEAWAVVIDKLSDEESAHGHIYTAKILQEVVAHKIRQSINEVRP